MQYPSADQIIASCSAYRPYQPIDPRHVMPLSEVIGHLNTLRAIHLGTPQSMALGIAINILSNISPEDYGLRP